MRKALVPLLLAAGLALIGYHGLKPPAPPTLAQVESRVAAPARPAPVEQGGESAVASRASRRPVAGHEPARDFAAQLADLERAAAAGDIAAASRLGELLALCRDYSPMSERAIEESIVTGMAAFEPPPPVGGMPPPPELAVLMAQQGFREVDRQCAGSEKLVDAARAQAAPRWLQRAADAGDPAASANLAHHLLFETETAETESDQRVRRARALDYLDRAIRGGSARALQIRGSLYENGVVLPADAVAAYAHLQAFAQTDEGRQWPPRLLELYRRQLAHPLDASQLAEAQRRGDALWRECCAHGAR